MPVAEIIAIGTELLLGEIQDSNSKFLARKFRDAGIDLFRITIVGDNLTRIEQAIQEALQRADIVLTSGGLGPTVDDPTRQAVANAISVELAYQPALWDQIVDRFNHYGRTPTENNKRQAYIPQGAIPIENAVGTAPCFICEINQQAIISLPGVPNELEFLMTTKILPYLSTRYNLGGQVIKSRVLHIASMGESTVDAMIGDLETCSNPTVGLLAHPGQVDVRITAKAASANEAEALIAPMAQEIQTRLQANIYGMDEEKLEEITAKLLLVLALPVLVIELGTNGETAQRLKLHHPQIQSINTLPESFNDNMNTCIKSHNGFLAGIQLIKNSQNFTLFLSLHFKENVIQQTRAYGGPEGNAISWASTLCLDLIRRTCLDLPSAN